MAFRILLAADGSPIARNAARFLVERFALPDERCSLDVIHVHYALPPRVVSALGGAMAKAYYRDESAKALASVQRLLDASNVPYRIVTKVGMPAARIADHASENGADLIVMGSHGRGAAKSLLLGSVAQGVLAGCSVPILLVRESRLPAADGPVMIAVDGSAFTKTAIAWLVRHRSLVLGQRELVLIHVGAEADRPGLPLGKAKSREIQEAEFEQALAPARRQLERAAMKWRELCTHGEPGPKIAEAARSAGCGLVVMGSHGRGGMTSLLLGSVAQRTLSESSVPILVVR